MGLSKWVIGGAAVFFAGAGSADAAINVATSTAEFAGTQGQNGWFYGYYNKSSDNTPGYTSGEFQQFPRYTAAEKWHIQNGVGGFYTYMDFDRAHPNAAAASAGRQPVEHWAVRRWVSDVAGAVDIFGELAKCSAQGGDGVIGQVFVDGQLMYTRDLGYDQLVPVNYAFSANVNVGSIVDFVMLPKATDHWDTTIFTGNIVMSVVPEPGTMAMVGLVGMMLAARRRPVR